MTKFSFLVLSANSPWTYGMAEALAYNHHTHAVQFYDWQTYRLIRPSWSERIPPSLLQRSIHVLPTGYAGRLEGVFRFYLQQLIQHWCQQLKRVSGEHPWVIASEPYCTPWVRKVPSERLIYYNFDDYVLYRPSRKDKILEQEKELIERAAITLCASYSQFITLQKRHPDKASCVYHYPHGFVSTYLNPQPENLPEEMTVGYVGNLIERIDWQLVYQVVQACPDITFVFVGGLDGFVGGGSENDWWLARSAVLALPNVRHIGKVAADQVAKYYWSFTVNWIPYVVEHPFNQASCPTKIMDGIASGRPILSTDIPECRLYPAWIKIFDSVENAIALIRQQLSLPQNPEKQLEFARQHTWQMRVHNLEKWIVNHE
jgi:teichuronic acid biosynthesis glycosyltransferase TuaH